MDTDVQVKFGADISDFTDKMGSITTASRGYDQELVNALNAQNVASSAAAKGLGDVAKATTTVNFATAQATREYIVLGREVMTGNFSRIPGSLLVLANRLGGLQSIMNAITPATIAWVAAIGATLVGLDKWITAEERLAETEEQVRGAMELNNESLSYSAQTVELNIMKLRLFGDVSSTEAQKIAVAFARTGALSEDLREKLIAMVGDYAAATGKDAPKAAEDLIKIFSDPQKGAEQLANTFREILTPAQLEQIEEMGKTGASANEMGETLIADVAPKLDNFRESHLTPLQKDLQATENAFTQFWYAMFHEGQAYDFSKPNIGQTVTTSPDQSAAIEAQVHQNALNDAESKGLDVLKSVHLEQEQINLLTEKRQALVNATNAAMEKGDLDLATQYENAITDIDRKITQEKKRETAQQDADARRSLEEQLAIAREKVSTQEQLDTIELQRKKDILQQEVADHRISNAQALELERQYAQEEYNISYNALVQEARMNGLSAQQKQEIYDKIQILYAKHLAEMEKLTAQSTKSQNTEYHQFFSSIESASDQMIAGVLQGTQTWQQAMGRLFDNLALKFIDDFVVKSLFAWIEKEVAMTSATVAGDAARTASNVGAAGVSSAAEAAAAKGSVSTSASRAAAAVYADVAEIPYVGWLLAPPAAAAAFVAVEAFGSGIASYDTGTNYVPQDGLAMLHQGEQIIPANQQGPAFSNGESSINVNINAVDAQSVASLLKSNAGVITQIVSTATRNFSPHLPAWKAS